MLISGTRPLTDPILSWTGGDLWVLAKDWSVSVDGRTFKIPEGFTFDLASIPRLMWVVPGFAPFELSTAAPLLHDFIYRYRGLMPVGVIIYRAQADRFFRLIMAEEGVGRVRRNLAWLAVRVGGWISWRR